jgi:hypothetical protein
LFIYLFEFLSIFWVGGTEGFSQYCKVHTLLVGLTAVLACLAWPSIILIQAHSSILLHALVGYKNFLYSCAIMLAYVCLNSARQGVVPELPSAAWLE